MLTRKDSIIKALTYRVFTSILTFFALWIVSGRVDVATMFTAGDFFLRTASYYIHERLFFVWKQRQVANNTPETVNSPKEEVPPLPTIMCRCGDRPADKCDEEWGPKCDLGNNPKFVRRVEDKDVPLTGTGAFHISTEHGPWVESNIHKGETYCKRCLCRDIFRHKKKCDPHLRLNED